MAVLLPVLDDSTVISSSDYAAVGRFNIRHYGLQYPFDMATTTDMKVTPLSLDRSPEDYLAQARLRLEEGYYQQKDVAAYVARCLMADLLPPADEVDVLEAPTSR